ncbi:MAG: hypothetical protein QFX35_03930 [Candidatus Verstraetearchaeota archaeon]|nr:hypothetical protein [Candidatus Verstraetearchaeota archaeon]
MVQLPANVMAVLNDPKATKVIGTKTPEGHVHIIPVGSLMAPNPTTIVAGAVLMKRTSSNLEKMKSSKEFASVLAVKEMTSYEIKVEVKEFQTSGEILDRMNVELKKMGLSARGVWILEPKEVWNQSASYEAGKKIA